MLHPTFSFLFTRNKTVWAITGWLPVLNIQPQKSYVWWLGTISCKYGTQAPGISLMSL